MHNAGPESASSRAAALIVGGGFSGVAALRVLRERGIDARLVEAGDDLGGVWYWNRYPGARCDAEVADYSFGFPELDAEWEWSHRFAYGPEIRAHIAHAAERFGLTPHVELGTRIAAARFDAGDHSWVLTTADGRELRAAHVVWATGSLSSTQLPAIPGLDEYTGHIVHTAAWPDGGLDVSGLTVGVIGTGSSGVQVVPELARQAGRLVVFQRTANHVVPAHNRALGADDHAAQRAQAVERRAVARAAASGLALEPPTRRAVDVAADERAAEFERRWAMGGFNMLVAFSDLDTDERAAAMADAFVRAKIRELVADPQVAERLMPADHPFGTKRVGVGEGYYETFNRANVRLADARTEPIERGTPRGLLLGTGEEVALDVLVCATGFDSFTGALARIDVRGRDGIALADRWAEGPRTYVGLGVPGFPNMWILNGPGSPSVFGNAPITAQDTSAWLAGLLHEARARGVVEVEAQDAAAAAWTDHLDEVAGRRLLHKLKNTWYHGGNTPGKARRFMAYAGGGNAYDDKLGEVRDAGYEGFALTPGVPPAHVAGALVVSSDLEASLRLYRGVLGFDADAPRPLDAWVAEALGVSGGTMAELSADGFPAGRVWLVQPERLAPAPPGRTDRVENGTTSMVFNSAAIEAMAEGLLAAGAPRIAGPVLMTSEWGRSQEFISYDPDGAPVCLLEMLGPDGRPKLDLAAPWAGTRTDQASPLLRVSQFVADLDRAISFYGAVFGMEALETREFSGEVGGTLGIPPCRIRMTYMSAPVSPWEPGMTTVGLTEVSQPSLATRPAPPGAPFAGQVVTVVAAADPAAVRAAAAAAGARTLDGGAAFFDPDDNLVTVVPAR
jgi:cation diffusion facilitator CzcD-associated flavoprotein CzcO/catechol 2,3-dioxygenase-like lactoylglutathione lyase family enzyme